MPNPVNPEAGVVLENPDEAYGLPNQDAPNLNSGTLHPGTGWGSLVPTQGDITTRPAAGNQGTFFIATWAGTTITRLYMDNGTDWVVPTDPPGTFNPLDYGADPTAATSSRQAVIDCLDAASEMWTGAPYVSGAVGGEVQWTAGQYTIDGGDIELPLIMGMTGVGGSGGVFAEQNQVVIAFSTGGFVTSASQSSFTTWRGLFVLSGNGTPLRANRGAGPGVFRDCSFRATGSGDPAVQIDNAFLSYFDNCGFQCKDQTAGSASVEIITSAAGGYEGWNFEFHYCVFNHGGLVWDIDARHPGNRVYGPLIVHHCLGENFANGNALVTIQSSGVTSPDVGKIAVTYSYMDDSGAGCDVLRLKALSSGSLTAFYGIDVTGSSPSNSGAHVAAVEPSTGFAEFDGVASLSEANLTVVWSAGAVGGRVASFVNVVGDRASAGVAQYRIKGDAHNRVSHRADGSELLGFGVATEVIYRGACSGSPEGVITSSPGGFAQSDTGVVYVKATGTGNTGWVVVDPSLYARLTANTFTAAQQIRPTASAAKALQLRASTTAPGNIQEWQDSSGTALLKVAATGYIATPSETSYLDLPGGDYKLTLANARSVTVIAGVTPSAAMQSWQDSSNNVLSRINKAGYFMTRKVGAPADADLANSELAIWLDDTPGATLAKFKAKDSGGTVRTGSVTLS